MSILTPAEKPHAAPGPGFLWASPAKDGQFLTQYVWNKMNELEWFSFLKSLNRLDELFMRLCTFILKEILVVYLVGNANIIWSNW